MKTQRATTAEAMNIIASAIHYAGTNGLTRRELENQTGGGMRLVHKVVGELLDLGIIVETGEMRRQESGAGAPAKILVHAKVLPA